MQSENGATHTVIRGMTGALVTPQGDPVPPQAVVARLKEYNAQRGTRYQIAWVKGAWGASYFGLKDQWAERDPRREEIQRGARDPGSDFDLLTMFPPECPADNMIAWLESQFGRVYTDPVGEAAKRVDEAQRHYDEVMQGHVNAAVDTGTERILSETNHSREVRAGAATAHPMVPGADFTEPKRLIAKPEPAGA